MPCAPPPRSSCSKVSTRIAASAAARSAASPAKKNRRAPKDPNGKKARKARARETAPTSAAGTTNRCSMKWIKYSKYTGEDFGIDADDLLKALADFLLQSGYNGMGWREQTLEDLKEAI